MTMKSKCDDLEALDPSTHLDLTMKVGSSILSLVATVILISCEPGYDDHVHSIQCRYTTTVHSAFISDIEAGFMGDSTLVPSTYDLDEFKARLVQLMMAGFGWEKGERYYFTGVDFEKAKRLQLIESCQFEADTDFVLLTYYPRGREGYPSGGGPKGNLYAGYVKPTDKLYLLSDGFGPTTEEEFNRILSENDGTPHLSDMCKACLLIRLKYMKGSMAVVRSTDDLDVWKNQWNVIRELPAEWQAKHSLFTFFPAEDTIEMAFVDSMKSEGEVIDTSYLGRRFTVVPPTVVNHGDSTVVTLTVHIVSIPLQDEEAATWRIAFGKSGYVTSMGYVGNPVLYLGFRPYYHRYDPDSPLYDTY